MGRGGTEGSISSVKFHRLQNQMTLSSVPVSFMVSRVTVGSCFIFPCLVSPTRHVGIVLEVMAWNGFCLVGATPAPSGLCLWFCGRASCESVGFSQPRIPLMLFQPLLGQYSSVFFIFIFFIPGKLAIFAQRTSRNVIDICDIIYRKSKPCLNGLKYFCPIGYRMSDISPHQSCV